jgi:hypothetical protein
VLECAQRGRATRPRITSGNNHEKSACCSVVEPWGNAADLKAYVHELGVAQGVLKKAGALATVRIWQAQFAGEDAGTVVVQLEFANLGALARYYDATRSNPELAAELANLATM